MTSIWFQGKTDSTFYIHSLAPLRAQFFIPTQSETWNYCEQPVRYDKPIVKSGRIGVTLYLLYISDWLYSSTWY